MAGGTRLTNAVELQGSGLLSVVVPLATSRVKRAVATNLDTLREILERDLATLKNEVSALQSRIAEIEERLGR